MTTYIPQLTLPQSFFSNPAISILLPIALGTGIGFSVRPSNTQNTYKKIKNPPFNPPPWVFGPTWTVLYGLMGYAAHRAVHLGTSPLALPSTIAAAKSGATLYTIQLGLNFLWMPLFFGWNRPVLATVDILALLGVNGYLTYLWGGVDSVAGWCLVPYLGWLGFATYLCVGATWLNGGDLRQPVEKKEL